MESIVNISENAATDGRMTSDVGWPTVDCQMNETRAEMDIVLIATMPVSLVGIQKRRSRAA